MLPRFRSLEDGYLYYKVLFYGTTIPAIATVVGAPQLLVAFVGGLIGRGTRRRTVA